LATETKRERILLKEQNLYSSCILKKLFLIRFYSVSEERKREKTARNNRILKWEHHLKMGREKFLFNEYENSSTKN